MTGKQYLAVLRSPGIGVWFAVLVCQRFPVAAAPLALVFLGHAATGSYAVGALLGGGHALAEAVAAGPLGRRFDRRPARAEAALVLGVEAGAFALLAAFAATPRGPWTVPGMLALAGLGGAISAGANGGLRALLVRLAPGERRIPALSLESAASTTVWTVAPAVVALLAAADPRIAVLLMAATAAAGALIARRLADPSRASGSSVAGRLAEPSRAGTATPAGLWRTGWPAMAFDGAMMFAFGAVSLALPTLLITHGAGAGLSGPVLTAYTLAGIGGGLLYGVRAWRGSPLAHATLLATGIGLALGAAALVPALGLVVVLFAAAGLLQTPALTARAVALQDRLPESQWAVGFSGMYAAGGLGYGAAGLSVAWLVDRIGAQPAIGLCVALSTLVVLVSSAAESRAAVELRPARAS
ncbi:hypothetical protein [Nonomuraea typhae]|uniref:hypothetical protein n=1 Tax=Nonomuraea typhae TaxID=2603600 RepID=UPI0012F9844B|nr:hypothetical protein [Nonomuraea typhae]